MRRFSLVPSAYVALLRGSEVLLQRRMGTGYMDGHWSVGAAGHVEHGESVYAAAVREVDEELGVRVRESDLEPICTMHRRSGGDAVGQRVDFFFAARKWEGEPSVTEPDKSDGIRWAALDALPEPMVPYVIAVLEMLRTSERNAIVHTGF
jgi:ADP-ribose pyrophosphatase YjhB (NUDIX family)